MPEPACCYVVMRSEGGGGFIEKIFTDLESARTFVNTKMVDDTWSYRFVSYERSDEDVEGVIDEWTKRSDIVSIDAWVLEGK